MRGLCVFVYKEKIEKFRTVFERINFGIRGGVGENEIF